MDAIEMTVWVKRGPMLVRRDALDGDDPDHPYNYIAGLGLCPEDYGLEKPPQIKRCPSCGEPVIG